jgi:hypothetical protein
MGAGGVMDVVAVAAATTTAAPSGWYASAPIQFERLRSHRQMHAKCVAAVDEVDIGRLTAWSWWP